MLEVGVPDWDCSCEECERCDGKYQIENVEDEVESDLRLWSRNAFEEAVVAAIAIATCRFGSLVIQRER